MKKITLSKLGLDLYTDTLENGLKIYILPKTGNNIYVTFTTQYGSRINQFVPNGETSMITVPDGIAHFLEHKVFEEKNGEDPFTFFGARGADANASTSYEKTTYLFSGTSSFEENINYLLDFVQNPYFTDENVEKEKGIIGEEIKMYEDNPFSKMYEKTIYNSFVLDPIRIPTQGTIESISKIDKDMLYTCYNTFYHPSNMIVVVTGNVDPEETISLIKKNQENKTFSEKQKIEVKTYEEPDTVFKEEETLYMNASIPKFCVGIKIKYQAEDLYLVQTSLSHFFNSKFGITSLFSEELKKKGLISDDLGISSVRTDTHFLFMIMGESSSPEDVIQRIKEELTHPMIQEEELLRKKKVMLSSYIYMSDNIYSLNNKILSNIIRYNKFIEDDKEMEKLTYSKFKEIMKKLDFTNTSSVIIRGVKENI